MTPALAPVSVDAHGAALITGVSVDVIRRAMRAGELPVRFPRIDGKQVNKPLILADDLRAWVERGDTERKTSTAA